MPGTVQRPDKTRHPTKPNRTTMKVPKPDQIPASPQPKINDSQINGKNPADALISVALRMNLASPAPTKTPSRLNTIP